MIALLSVSDKTGIVELARGLHAQGVRLLSTGGTARLLAEAGLPVTEVAQWTQFPEMLDGRVKTLHPRIHAGLLARRSVPEHRAALAQHGIEGIDLLVVNLYPFEAVTAKSDCTLLDAMEHIDIGGPAMVRSAAKNWQHVGVVTDPQQYPQVLQALQGGGALPDALRFALAVAAFNRIAAYDAAISNYLSSVQLPDAQPLRLDAPPARAAFPAQYNASFTKVQDLRYGENSHQQAAFYRAQHAPQGLLASAHTLQGKELSYNNLADADAAWQCATAFARCACVIVKHANPCGVAVAETPAAAYARAFATDPTSAFGGIIAFNRALDEDAAQAVAQQFVEVVLAPHFSDAAKKVFAAKPNVRLLQIALPDGSAPHDALDMKRIGGGLLLQSMDTHELALTDLQIVTQKQPTPAQLHDALFAWKVAQYVKSNAIVFCKDGATLGVGAGQMSRLDSARIARIKAEAARLDLHASVVASDAFFPFRDGLDVVLDAGATCVVQPGGSVRDREVIDAANERGVAMVLTGVRHFRH